MVATVLPKSVERMKKPVMFQLPLQDYSTLQQRAEEQNVKVGTLAAKIVAEWLGSEYVPSPAGRARIYASPEERKAAQREKAQRRRQRGDELLEAFKTMDLDKIRAVLEKYGDL